MNWNRNKSFESKEDVKQLSLLHESKENVSRQKVADDLCYFIKNWNFSLSTKHTNVFDNEHIYSLLQALCKQQNFLIFFQFLLLAAQKRMQIIFKARMLIGQRSQVENCTWNEIN